MLDDSCLSKLEQVVLTVSMPGCPDWQPIFPVAHMAEHLMGRCLLSRPFAADLTGSIRRNRITIRFVAPQDQVDNVLVPEVLNAVLHLEEITESVFRDELRTLTVEDSTLPPPLQSAGRLPASWPEFQRAWIATGPVAQWERRPFLSPRLVANLRQSAEPERKPKGTHADKPAVQAERGKAYGALCRRLGRPPEFFMDGEGLQSYYGPTSIFLSGLSAYRSPLFQRLRQGDSAIYAFNFFDFPWRRCSFIAFVAVPPVGEAAFATTVGRRAAAMIDGLSTRELQTVLFDGTLKKLRDLETTLASPRKSACLRYLAQLNGFSPDPTLVARSVIGCRVSDLENSREVLLGRFLRQLSGTVREVG
jgi:hypothetical protein